MNVGDVLGFFRRGRKPDLGSCGEVFQNLSPRGIIGSATAVALIDDDQVKEAG